MASLHDIGRSWFVWLGLLLVGIGSEPRVAEGQALHYWVQVEGLSCPFCMAGLKKSFAKLPGVRDLSADFEARQLRFAVDSSVLLRPERVREAVADGGFTARALSVRLRGEAFRSADGSLRLRVEAGGARWTLRLRGGRAFGHLTRWVAGRARAVRLVGRLLRQRGSWTLRVDRAALEPWRERRREGG